jgi:predicted membrane channel-forming protein YqfA (hemolysin III family)
MSEQDKNNLQIKIIISATILTVLFGTVFYHKFEGWSYVDSFYFTVITLTTVGYGDFSPTTPFTKLFTVFYIIVGISILAAFINVVAKGRMQKKMQRNIKKNGSN